MKIILWSLLVLFSFHSLTQDTISGYCEEVTGGSIKKFLKNQIKFYKYVKIYVFGEKNDTLIVELIYIVG